MSLKDRLAAAAVSKDKSAIIRRFGVAENPYPASSQTTDNPHHQQRTDEEIETRIESFVRDQKSQVIVVVGTQGTGKTNVLNHFERELTEWLNTEKGYYIVRYLADPEASFDSTLRRLFQELGIEHLRRLGKALARIMHDGAHFCTSDGQTRAVVASREAGVKQLVMQRVWG